MASSPVQGGALVNDSELAALYNSLDTILSDEGLNVVWESLTALLNQTDDLFEYPPQHAGANYIRTFALQRSIQWELLADGRDAIVGASVDPSSPAYKYAEYVIGDTTQQSEFFKRYTEWEPLGVLIEQDIATYETFILNEFERYTAGLLNG